MYNQKHRDDDTWHE